MNLRPRAVNFEDVWLKLKETVEAIVALRPIERITWDHNFRYPLFKNLKNKI